MLGVIFSLSFPSDHYHMPLPKYSTIKVLKVWLLSTNQTQTETMANMNPKWLPFYKVFISDILSQQ